jgi:glycosyltransferase involved in cell wall biosynthesis
MRILWLPHLDWQSIRQNQREYRLAKIIREAHDIHVVTYARTQRNAVLNSLRAKTWKEEGLTFYQVPRIPNVVGQRLHASSARGLRINELLHQYAIRELVKRKRIELVICGISHQAVGLPPDDLPVPLVFDYLDYKLEPWPEVERAYMRMADAVTCTSQVLFERASRLHPHAYHLSNGVDLSAVAAARPSRVRDMYNLHGAKVVSLIGIHASPRPFYVDAIAMAARDVPNLTFLLVGEHSAFSEAIIASTQQLGVRTIATGLVPPSEVADFFAATDVGLFPGDKTAYFDATCPLKVLEYSAAGKPVVATDLAELRNWSFPNVHLCPPTAEAFAVEIKRALSEPHALPDLSEMDWSRLGNRLNTILSEVAARGKVVHQPPVQNADRAHRSPGFPSLESEAVAGPRARTLVVISVPEPDAATRAAIDAGRSPRRDFDVLADRLGADLLFLDAAAGSRVAWIASRLVGARIGQQLALAYAAFQRRGRYDTVFTDTEAVGLPFAMLLKLTRADPSKLRHVTLSHNLSSMRNRFASAVKRHLLGRGIATHISMMIVHSSAQEKLATSVFGIPPHRVIRLPYQVDASFWHPLDGGPDTVADHHLPIIPVPGHECRDYPTLLAAIAGLDIDARISTRAVTSELAGMMRRPDWPSNLTFREYGYETLRLLYDNARFVVVPVLDVDFQAGITVVLEAMAMGKAVILSGISGQTDVLRDPRDGRRGLVVREWGTVSQDTDAATVEGLPTGFYVTPGDPTELRALIEHLLAHPDEAEALGRNGRTVAEAFFTVEAFAERFAAVILGHGGQRTGAEAVPAGSRT